MLEAGMQERLAQACDGIVVFFLGLRAHKAHRPTDHGVANVPAELLFGCAAQVFDHARDQILKRVAAAEDLSAGERAAGKMGLERLNEAAFFLRLQIVLDGLRAGERVQALGRAGLELFEIEHRSIRLGCGRCERK